MGVGSKLKNVTSKPWPEIISNRILANQYMLIHLMGLKYVQLHQMDIAHQLYIHVYILESVIGGRTL